MAGSTSTGALAGDWITPGAPRPIRLPTPPSTSPPNSPPVSPCSTSRFSTSVRCADWNEFYYWVYSDLSGQLRAPIISTWATSIPKPRISTRSPLRAGPARAAMPTSCPPIRSSARFSRTRGSRFIGMTRPRPPWTHRWLCSSAGAPARPWSKPCPWAWTPTGSTATSPCPSLPGCASSWSIRACQAISVPAPRFCITRPCPACPPATGRLLRRSIVPGVSDNPWLRLHVPR